MMWRRCLGRNRIHWIGGLAPRHHQAGTASMDWRACTWPSDYGGQHAPAPIANLRCQVHQRRNTTWGRGATVQAGFSDAA